MLAVPKVIPHPPLVWTQIGAAILESVRRILKNLKINRPYVPAIPLLGISPKDSTSYSTDVFL